MTKQTSPEWPIAKTAICVRGSGKDGAQVIQCSDARWNEVSEAIFLEHLASSCNVTLSCEKAGFSRAAVYKQRMNNPAFADKWKAAIEQGYVRIEALLLESAEKSLAGLEFDPDSPIPQMTVSEATNILRLHKAAVKDGNNSPFRWRLKPADPEAAVADMLQKVAAVRRAKGYE